MLGAKLSARSSHPEINVNTVIWVNRHSCTITRHRYTADIIRREATNAPPFENRSKVATLYSITLVFFFPPLPLISHLFNQFHPLRMDCYKHNFYLRHTIRNKAYKISKICSPKQHLLVSVCRLIESLCAVISVECSLTNIITYLVQLVLH